MGIRGTRRRSQRKDEEASEIDVLGASHILLCNASGGLWLYVAYRPIVLSLRKLSLIPRFAIANLNTYLQEPGYLQLGCFFHLSFVEGTYEEWRI